jgi:hypothetical protein
VNPNLPGLRPVGGLHLFQHGLPAAALGRLVLGAVPIPAARQIVAQEAPEGGGRSCGAAEYRTKPFDPEDLLAALRTHADVA